MTARPPPTTAPPALRPPVGAAPYLLVTDMDAFLGRWRLEQAACQGYEEFMAAEVLHYSVLTINPRGLQRAS